MKINVINRIDLSCLDAAIAKAGDFDYLVMNSQTLLQNSLALTWQVSKDKICYKYKGFNIAISESLPDGEIKIVKEV